MVNRNITQYLAIFITTSSVKEARKISKALLDKKLVACVNIVPNIESCFWWKGKIEKAKEYLLIAKSLKSRFAKVVNMVKSMHSYEVPEIIAMPIVKGDKYYLDWMEEAML